MNKFLFLSIAMFFLWSCNSENASSPTQEPDSGALILDVDSYFYPKDTVVQMYVYQNVKDQSDQYFERVIYRFMDERDHFFVTRYNSQMEPISTFSYWNVEGEIRLMKANLMVNRMSYEARITENLHFPISSEELAKVNYDYPSDVDSIINVIEIRRSFSRFDTIPEAEGDLPVIVFQDSLRISFVDIKNKQHKSIPASLETYYGKGVGKIRETNPNKTFRLVLKTNYGTFQNIK